MTYRTAHCTSELTDMAQGKFLDNQRLSRRQFAACLALTGVAATADSPLAMADDRASRQASSSNPKSRRIQIKKGVCGKGGKCDMTGVGWYYNWTRNPAPGKINAEFVPMIKGKGNANSNTFAKIQQLKKTHGVTHLLGFNEPDSKSQGNTTVEQAVALWPKLMKTGLRLGSPAATDNRAGKEWFTNFMAKAAAKKFRIDFIAIHRYPDIRKPNSVQQFFRSLDEVHRQYRRPIWITEFSGLNFGSKNRKMTPQDNYRFMREVLPRLQQLAYVERYAWYSGRATDISRIYDPSKPSGLNSLGEFYRTI